MNGPNTPIPKPTDFGVLLASVKDDLSEIKPDVRQTREALIIIKTDLHNTKGRVKKLETKTNGVVAEVQTVQTSLSLKVNTAESNIAGNSTDIDDIKKKDSKRLYWLLGAGAMVMAAVAGWLTTMATMEANVEHLRGEQAEISDSLGKLTTAHKNQSVRVQQATKAVQSAAHDVRNGEDKSQTFEAWYETLTKSERHLLQRQWRSDRLRPPPPGIPLE